MKKASIKSITSKYAKSAKSKFDKTRSYSSFWMDKTWSVDDKFGGLGGFKSNYSSDIVKAIRLAAYQRAIGNFTKILTKKDIRLVFSGNESFTDGNTISIASNLGDKNFDTHVGLALHEASHCILTDFEATKEARSTYSHRWQKLFPLINWIEDRRIDHYVFTSSPGYKAYYHKLYDTYFHSPEVDKLLKSAQTKDASNWQCWELRIVNSLNALADPNAMRGLAEVLGMIDVANIARLKTTGDVVELAVSVLDRIEEIQEEQKPLFQTPQQQQEGDGEADEQKSGNGSSSNSAEDNDEENDQDESPRESQKQKEEDGEAQGSGSNGGDDYGDDDEDDVDGGSSGEGNSVEDMSDETQAALNKALNKQEAFMDGKIDDRKQGSKNLQKKLDSLTSAGADIQQVGDSAGKAQTAIIYDLAKNGRLFMDYLQAKVGSTRKKAWQDMTTEERAASETAVRTVNNHPLDTAIQGFFYSYSHHADSRYNKAINEGLELGAFLGRKLQLRNETRDLTFNRLNSGLLDSKRIAHAGYGIENVFKQIHIDKYKASNLHISLDASGSMSGGKWEKTLTMTMAIAKAAKSCTNLNVQVSLRHTENRTDNPVVVMIYDSRKNPLQLLELALRASCTNSVTPEGLCYEAMIKRNLFVPTTSECDSYMINISDGYPGGCGGYDGPKAWKHTRDQVTKLEGMGIKTLSFYVVEHTNPGPVGEAFIQMYGAKNSASVGAKDMVGIAKAMNSKFLQMA
jgi:hypothetical protein